MAALEKTQALQRVLVHFFRMMPPFLLGEALIELTRLHFLRSIVLAGASIPGAAPSLSFVQHTSRQDPLEMAVVESHPGLTVCRRRADGH